MDMLTEAASAGVIMQAAIEQNRGGIGNEWDRIVSILHCSIALRCGGSSCWCLDLQAALQQLLTKAAQQRPKMEDLIKLGVHMVLPAFTDQITACKHGVAARLAVAQAYYK
jgi:hypothetical protein